MTLTSWAKVMLVSNKKRTEKGKSVTEMSTAGGHRRHDDGRGTVCGYADVSCGEPESG